MPEAPKRNNLLQFALIFALVYLAVQILFPQPTGPKTQPSPGLLAQPMSNITVGHYPVLTLQNVPASSESHGLMGWMASKWCDLQQAVWMAKGRDCSALAQAVTGQTVTLPDRCPRPPVDVFTVEGTGSPQGLTPVTSSDTAVPCEPVEPIKPGQTVQVSLAPWTASIFGKLGTYEVRVPVAQGGSGAVLRGNRAAAASGALNVRFAMVEPGFFTKLFRTFITAPFLNFLIFAGSLVPSHNLGLSIIILTLLVKLILFFPTQHAMEGQKKMQILQPKLQTLKEKYKGDNKKIQEETMRLWKEHKINPLQSCLPTVIQLPVLIGLLYVIRDDTNLALSRYLIYPFYQHLTWHFNTQFLWMDLLKPDIVIMPLLLVILQYLQMKLTFSIQSRKQKQEVIDVGGKARKDPAQGMQQTLLLYGLPLMIGFFAIKFPAAVALYWGVSTLFAIGQQVIVNREHLRV